MLSKKLNHLLNFESEINRGSLFVLKILPDISSIDKGKYNCLKNYFAENNKIIPIRRMKSKDNIKNKKVKVVRKKGHRINKNKILCQISLDIEKSFEKKF